jgi:hypothetical protein
VATKINKKQINKYIIGPLYKTTQQTGNKQQQTTKTK